MSTLDVTCVRRGRRLLLACFSLLAVAILPSNGLAQSPVELNGFVRAAEGGGPIGSARVTVEDGGPGAFTDASGRFRLTGLPTGTHTLVVERLGFETTRIAVTVSSGEGRLPDLEVLLVAEPVLVSGIVVTASGEIRRRVETAASIGRLDGNRIREVNPSHPAEIMNRLPGVWVSPTSGEGHMTAIRQPITTNPVYLFLEDGVPTRSPGFFNHNALYEVNVPQADRIEVIRGPGTALYGSDAIGGVVDVGTRPPTSGPEAELGVEMSSLGFRRVLATVSGTRGEDGVRGDVNFTVGDDWRDHGEYDRQVATLRWDRRLGGATSLRTTATYSNVFQSDPSVVTRADLDSDPSVNRHPITFRRVEAARVQSRLEHRRDGSVFEVTPFLRWNTLELMPSWLLGFDPVVYASGHTSVGAMARLHRDLTHRGRLTVGIDADRSPGFREEDRITVARENGFAVDWSREERIYDYTATFSGLSPYLQLQYRALPTLHLSGGLRFDAISFEYRSRLAPVQTGPHRRPQDTTVRYSNLGPSLGAAFTPSPELNLFAGFRESFRAPSEGQLFRQGTAESTVDLEPVQARSAEAGVRGEVAGRVAYELSGYRMEVRNDILSFVRPEDGRTESMNAGRTRHQGLEAGLTVALPAGVEADLSLARASHRYLEWSPREGVSYAGRTLPQAPRDLASARLRLPVPGTASGRLEMEWMRMGSFWMDPENLNAYEGHSLWNLRLEAPIRDGLVLSGRILNLTDRAYAERASYHAFRGEELSPGKPRTLQIGLRYGWDR